jgi:hypothetical protein
MNPANFALSVGPGARFIIAAVATFLVCSLLVPLALGLARALGLYTIVNEARCKVYMLFGKVVAVINEPGLHFLPAKLGPKAFIVNWLGQCHDLDLRMDQNYLRSQPVNSEEGAPMGIGIWYEMYISDPIAYLFKNADPRGSLAANVSNSTVRCLSNLPLDKMLQDRHAMSQTVRAEVSPQSNEWGYQLGSVHPQSPLSGHGHDQADRGQGRQPPAPGHVGHQAGGGQPGEHHQQHGRTPGGHRIRQSRRHASPHCRGSPAGNLPGRPGEPGAV